MSPLLLTLLRRSAESRVHLIVLCRDMNEAGLMQVEYANERM